MEVIFDNKSAMYGILTLQFEQAEIKTETDKKLKQVARTASVKGFRPGKVPPAVLSKLYGKEMRYEAINKLLEGALQEFLEKEREKVLFSPMMADSPAQDELLTGDCAHLNFTFDVMLKPDFELPEGNFTYEKLLLQPDSEDIDNMLQDIVKNKAKDTEAEVVGEESSILGKLNIPQVDYDGTITVSMNDLTESGKAAMLGKKVDDVHEGVLSDWFTSPEVFERVVEGLEGDVIDFSFTFKIGKIKDRVPAEINESLFREVLTELGFIKPKPPKDDEELETEGEEGSFAEEVQEEEEEEAIETATDETEGPITETYFREKLVEYLKNQYANTLDQVEENAVFDQLLNKLSIPFDDEILVKFIKAQAEVGKEEEISPKRLDAMKRSMASMLLNDKIAKIYNIEVTEEEVLDHAALKLQGQFRAWGLNMPFEQVKNMAPDFMKRDNGKSYDEYRRAVFSKKCIDVYKREKFEAVEKEVSIKGLDEVIKRMNESYNDE